MNKMILLLLFSVTLASVSQILLKISADKKHASVISQYLNPYVILAYSMLFSCTGIVIFAYKGIDFKYGPIIEAIGYPIIMVLSTLVLKEKITLSKIGGNLLIVLGVVIFSLN